MIHKKETPDSSSIARFAWDDASEELTVHFVSGHAAIYRGVPRSEFEAMRKARSAGGHHNACIRQKYATR